MPATSRHEQQCERRHNVVDQDNTDRQLSVQPRQLALIAQNFGDNNRTAKEQRKSDDYAFVAAKSSQVSGNKPKTTNRYEQRERRENHDFPQASDDRRVQFKPNNKQQKRDADITVNLKQIVVIDQRQNRWADDDTGDDMSDQKRLLEQTHNDRNHCRKHNYDA